MTSQEFDLIVEEQIKHIRKTLIEKAKEYANDQDRLHNFNRGAAISGQSKQRILWRMALKHYISFMDMIDDVDKGVLPVKEKLDEKIGDLINYLILAKACFLEEIDKQGEDVNIKLLELAKLGKSALKQQIKNNLIDNAKSY